jgi:hypothetical protein
MFYIDVMLLPYLSFPQSPNSKRGTFQSHKFLRILIELIKLNTIPLCNLLNEWRNPR